MFARRVCFALAALLAVAVAGAPAPGHGSPRPHVEPTNVRTLARAHADHAPQRGTGSIEGRVTMRRRPGRRTADRYPGATAGAADAVQAVPAVVFLRGRVPGANFTSRRFTLAQRDTAFVPAILVVPPGATVEFPNRDPFFHNVFSYSSPARFDLGRYPQGESKEVRFDEPGIVRIYCEVHETMRSVVIVNENPFHAVIEPDGRFSIAAVPDGRYELELWHPDTRGRVVPVVVESGRTTQVTLELS